LFKEYTGSVSPFVHILARLENIKTKEHNGDPAFKMFLIMAPQSYLFPPRDVLICIMRTAGTFSMRTAVTAKAQRQWTKEMKQQRLL